MLITCAVHCFFLTDWFYLHGEKSVGCTKGLEMLQVCGLPCKYKTGILQVPVESTAAYCLGTQESHVRGGGSLWFIVLYLAHTLPKASKSELCC